MSRAPVLLLLALTLFSVVDGFSQYRVGGSQGWNPNVNYTNWNNKTHYYVGDWIVFLYQSGMADVIRVNKTNYEQCIADNPISNYSKGRSYAFRLNHTGDFYFICSKGFCYGGMKLHIKAEALPPPSSPQKTQASAAESLRHRSVRVLGFATAVVAALAQAI